MRYLCIFFWAAAVCAGTFSFIPPLTDADPSIRHSVSVRVPTVMEVARHRDSMTISFPILEATNLMVGYKMATGIMHQESIYRDGVEQPRGMSLQDGLIFESSTNTLTFSQGGVPKPEFTLEHRVTMFETDMPSQHMWSPQSGKHYRVLWTRIFKKAVK
jgi:hypothetical protein